MCLLLVRLSEGLLLFFAQMFFVFFFFWFVVVIAQRRLSLWAFYLSVWARPNMRSDLLLWRVGKGFILSLSSWNVVIHVVRSIGSFSWQVDMFVRMPGFNWTVYTQTGVCKINAFAFSGICLRCLVGKLLVFKTEKWIKKKKNTGHSRHWVECKSDYSWKLTINELWMRIMRAHLLKINNAKV